MIIYDTEAFLKRKEKCIFFLLSFFEERIARENFFLPSGTIFFSHYLKHSHVELPQLEAITAL